MLFIKKNAYICSMKYTVYLIRHISTGQVLYVGKTNNFKHRAYEHLSLKTNSKDWLSSIGTNNVLIEEVAKFSNETDALKYEDELIIKYNTIENGYNEKRSGLITENKDEYYRERRKKDEYKEYQKKYQKKWFQTQRKGNKEWNEKHNIHQKKYLQRLKEKGEINAYKEYQKKYQIDYRQAKKMGITIDNYRKFEQNKKQPIQLTINF